MIFSRFLNDIISYFIKHDCYSKSLFQAEKNRFCKGIFFTKSAKICVNLFKTVVLRLFYQMNFERIAVIVAEKG